MAPPNYYQGYPSSNSDRPNQQQSYSPGFPAQHTNASQTPQYASHAYHTDPLPYNSNSEFNSSGWYGASSRPEIAHHDGAEVLSRLGRQEHHRPPDPRRSDAGGKYGSYMSGHSMAAPVYGSSMSQSAAPTYGTTSTSVLRGAGQRQTYPSSISLGPSASISQTSSHTESRVHRSPVNSQPRQPHASTIGRPQPGSSSPAYTAHHTRIQSPLSRPASSASVVPQYGSDAYRVLPRVTDAPQPGTGASSQHGYTNQPNVTTSGAPNDNRTSAQYESSNFTVDPSQVYDPWPDILRRQEEEKAVMAAEEARRAAEREREAEIARNLAVETKRIEDQKRIAEEAKRQVEEERRKLDEAKERAEEEERRTWEQRSVQARQKTDSKRQRKSGETRKPRKSRAYGANGMVDGPADSPRQDHGTAAGLETEIRAMMARMREFNAQDPSLLARLWEEERNAHLSASTPARNAEASPLAVQREASAVTAASSTPIAAPNHGEQRQDEQPSSTKTHAMQMSTVSQHSPATEAAMQPAPQKTQSGGTVWPPEKKAHLSAAASHWLNNVPENANQKITSAEICSILDRNPSYIELCEHLERTGLILDRAAFARALLAAVPDVNSAGPPAAQLSLTSSRGIHEPATATTNGPTNAQRPPLQPNRLDPSPRIAPSSLPVQQQQPINNVTLPGHSTQAPPVPSLLHSPLGAAFVNGSEVASLTSMGINPPGREKHLAKPVSKAEAARKRTFSEMVDLTVDSDEDELPYKRPEPEPLATTPAAPQPQQAPGVSKMQVDFRPYTYKPNTIPSTAVPAKLPAADNVRNADVVENVDKKKALRRSSYNVSTIARDVLIATGKHPAMRPLNAHLEPLRLNFRQVDYSSDLSTFRWDLVDPGNAVQQSDSEDADDEDEIDTPPQPRRANVRQAVDINGDLATFHQSAPPGTQPAKGVIRRKRVKHFTSDGSGIRSRPQGFEDGKAKDARTPPGSPPRQTDSPSVHRRSSNTPQPGNTHRAGSSSATPTGYSAFRQHLLGADGRPLPKKPGRPVGWRKAIHGSAAVNQGATSSGSQPTQPSRLRQQQSPAGVVVIRSRSPSSPYNQPIRRGKAKADEPEPKYSVYKCLWRECEAELHNLETLRKHVQKIHAQPVSQGWWECLWDECSTASRQKPDGVVHFSSGAAFSEHMEHQHLMPLAWKLGDGPAGGTSDTHDSDVSEAYLSDSRGRRVTPQVVIPSSATPGEREELANPSKPARGRKSAEEKAREAAQEAAKRKRHIGALFGPHGSRLATEERREVFDSGEKDEWEEVEADTLPPEIWRWS